MPQTYNCMCILYLIYIFFKQHPGFRRVVHFTVPTGWRIRTLVRRRPCKCAGTSSNQRSTVKRSGSCGCGPRTDPAQAVGHIGCTLGSIAFIAVSAAAGNWDAAALPQLLSWRIDR